MATEEPARKASRKTSARPAPPRNREMAILNGALQLSVPQRARGQGMPFDAFLRLLAMVAIETAEAS